MGRHTRFLTAAGVAALTVLACGGQGDESAMPTSFEAAKARAADTDKLLLVDFYASW